MVSAALKNMKKYDLSLFHIIDQNRTRKVPGTKLTFTEWHQGFSGPLAQNGTCRDVRAAHARVPSSPWEPGKLPHSLGKEEETLAFSL